MTLSSKTPIFGSIKRIDQLASMLGSSEKQLKYLLYGRNEGSRYKAFIISKRRGGSRTILAPHEDLKTVQRALAEILQESTNFRQSAHGFVRGKSIATNAEVHVGKRFVLNVDLKDFFPAINYGRVRGVFGVPPFCASDKVATVLAQICCHKSILPQGAPTSPVVSNIICYRMDRDLSRLAQKHRCVYTRYVDDMTFSKKSGSFPQEIAYRNEENVAVTGAELNEVISSNGFHIHPDKVHLFSNTHRQTVTGLTVNQKVNVSRGYIRQIRAMICDWRNNGQEIAEERHHESYYRHPDRLGDHPPIELIIEGKLNFLKMIRGSDDDVRKNLQRQFVEVYPDYESVMEKENRELRMRDLFISHASEDKVDLVRPLVQALIKEGVSVWYDEHELTIGSDMTAEINKGLIHSKYGVVVMSPNFFRLKKTWPDREVRAFNAQEDATGRSRILPIWHNIDQTGVVSKNPILGGLLAWKTIDHTPEQLAVKFREFLKTKNS